MAIKTKAQAQAIARAIKEGKATGQAKERGMALLRDYREKSQPSSTIQSLLKSYHMLHLVKPPASILLKPVNTG